MKMEKAGGSGQAKKNSLQNEKRKMKNANWKSVLWRMRVVVKPSDIQPSGLCCVISVPSVVQSLGIHSCEFV
jgi:hypothetical protein